MKVPYMLRHVLLQRRSIALDVLAYPVQLAHAGHMASSAKLDVIAARKIVLVICSPPRHVHVHAADAVMIVRSHRGQLREISGDTGAHGIGQIPAEYAG